MNVAALLTSRTSTCGESVAIIDGSRNQRTITFAELERAVACTTARLHRHGLRPGDSVLVLQPMSLELYCVLIAIFRSGLVAMFVDPSSGRHHLASCCKMNPPMAFIGSARAHLFRLISPALRRIPAKLWSESLVRSALKEVHVPDADVAIQDCPSDTPALIRFTSGSTGEPKAAVRTHGFLREQLRVIEANLQLHAGEVDLATMPMFVLSNLAAGVTSVIPPVDLRAPGRIDPVPLIRQIQSLNPDRITAAPSLLERLADHCARTSQTLGSFRCIYTGGAPVFPRLVDKLKRMSPHAEIVAVYGSTEAEPITHIRSSEISDDDRRITETGGGLLAGFSVPEIQLRIVREEKSWPQHVLSEREFADRCLPSDDAGEVVVSGPHVQPGYLHGVGDEDTKFRVDDTVWHRTGDAGRLDSSGRLWLLGRSSAKIHDARGVIYPFQVESAVLLDSRIVRAALVGHKGKRVLAVEPLQTGQVPELQAYARAQIDEIRILPNLPLDKRHNSKIDYVALQRLLG
jgi:acyl-CoA synthetase (AMP-forming)/AMP-acid ligase II